MSYRCPECGGDMEEDISVVHLVVDTRTNEIVDAFAKSQDANAKAQCDLYWTVITKVLL
jgi:hypothetical protein